MITREMAMETARHLPDCGLTMHQVLSLPKTVEERILFASDIGPIYHDEWAFEIGTLDALMFDWLNDVPSEGMRFADAEGGSELILRVSTEALDALRSAAEYLFAAQPNIGCADHDLMARPLLSLRCADDYLAKHLDICDVTNESYEMATLALVRSLSAQKQCTTQRQEADCRSRRQMVHALRALPRVAAGLRRTDGTLPEFLIDDLKRISKDV